MRQLLEEGDFVFSTPLFLLWGVVCASCAPVFSDKDCEAPRYILSGQKGIFLSLPPCFPAGFLCGESCTPRFVFKGKAIVSCRDPSTRFDCSPPPRILLPPPKPRLSELRKITRCISTLLMLRGFLAADLLKIGKGWGGPYFSLLRQPTAVFAPLDDYSYAAQLKAWVRTAVPPHTGSEHHLKSCS